ncbi:MAG TPA: fibronectin/fibrinogen-binding protein [Clostridiaceae bacterium]|nr:fibronectin/fibrinogen-binding protein [Clostridiaceae bacterium]
MPLDGVSARFLNKELNYELTNARVDRIYQPNRFTVLLIFHINRLPKKLLISANPGSPRIYLTTAELENPKNPPSFCMMLRKYLLGARLQEIIQPDYERVFIFKFSTINELGDPETKYLVTEIMGRHSNIIFLNQDKKIHDSLIHVDQDISSKREVMPARTYQLPPTQDKQSLDYYYEQKPSILSFLINTQESGKIDKAILSHVQGFSPLLVRSIIAAAGIESRLHVDQLSNNQKQELSNKFYKTCEMIKANADQPTLYFLDEHDHRPYDFHAFELRSLPYRETVSSFSIAMDVFYKLQDAKRNFEQFKQKLERNLNQAISRTQKKLDLHQRDFAEGQKAEQYQRLGELLNSQLYLVQDKATEVELIDYYDPEQKKIRVQLKPKLSPADNAKIFFKKYRKAQAKFQSAKRLLALDQAELIWLNSLHIALERAEVLEDLQAINIEFDLFGKPNREKSSAKKTTQPEQHLIKNRLNPGKPGKRKKYQQQHKQQNKQKTKNEKPLPPRKFELAEGITVYAGRNNIQNDQLTLRKAAANDLWFHVKDLAGTHVVLTVQNGYKAESQHIKKAAQIAAWYSEANQIKTYRGGKIAVDSCLVKHVKKPKGAKPGMVIYDQHQTYYVLPKLPEAASET